MNDQRIRFSNVRWAGVADRARMGGLLLLACAGLCAGPSAPAAQFVPLSSFGALYDSFSVRGPYGSVLVSGTNLLGVAGAGMWGNNVVFSLPADVSSGPASAHAFYMGSGYEGVEPAGGLTEQDGLLYGMTALSGASGFGSVFTLDPNNYFAAQVLHTFAGGSDGFQPCGTVAVGGGALYGLTGLGGTAGQGTLFTVQINGDGYAKLHDFAGGASDGAQPCGSPVLGGALLFGVTAAGGSGSTNSGTSSSKAEQRR